MKIRNDLIFAWALTALVILLVLGLERAATERTPQVKQEIVLPDIFLGK